jgi:hypothetical protein
MRNIINVCCLAGIFFMGSCQTQSVETQALNISKENQVILAEEDYFAAQYELWVPDKEQTDEALAVISTFLKEAKSNNSLDEYFKSEIEKIIIECSLWE